MINMAEKYTIEQERFQKFKNTDDYHNKIIKLTVSSGEKILSLCHTKKTRQSFSKHKLSNTH